MGILCCYRPLGKFLTFEITIRPDHKFVDTGPYAIVRHPSYLGSILMCFGTPLLTLSPQSPAIACGWLESYIFVKVIIAVLIPAFVASSCIERVASEEQNLRNYFGRVWDEVYQAGSFSSPSWNLLKTLILLYIF